jgi:hypothetical protein
MRLNSLLAEIAASGKSYSAMAKGVAESLSEAREPIQLPQSVIELMGTTSVPDITTDMEKVMGTVAPISGNNFSSWILSLETNIISGLFIAPDTALVTPLAPTPAFMKGLSISQSDLYSATGDENKDAQRIAWETICDKIIMWINSTPNAGLSYPSSHVASTGTSTIIKTTIV